jgi:hypothetical protein
MQNNLDWYEILNQENKILILKCFNFLRNSLGMLAFANNYTINLIDSYSMNVI